MSTFTKISKCSIIALAVFSGALSYAASDDDYLKQLEIEASEDIVDDPMEPAGFDETANENPSLDAPATDVELINEYSRNRSLFSRHHNLLSCLRKFYVKPAINCTIVYAIRDNAQTNISFWRNINAICKSKI